MAELAAPRPIRLQVAPMRWGAAMGWIAIYDREAKTWHEVRANDAPPEWRRIASEAKRQSLAR
jgi:hypothetical protein